MSFRRLALLTLPALVLCGGEVREEILVIVNGHVISRRVFQQAVEQGAAALYRQFSGKALDEKLQDARQKTLQGLIDNFIIRQYIDVVSGAIFRRNCSLSAGKPRRRRRVY